MLGPPVRELQRQMRENMEAVKQAHHMQQCQMNTGFQEIKALLQSTALARPAKRDVQEQLPEPGGMNDL